MKLAIRFVVMLSLFMAVKGFGVLVPRELLFSPSQTMRMLGAQALAKSYVPPSRAKGDKLVARLRLGMGESEVAGLLVSAGATNESVETIENEIVKTYRVDDLWVVRCWFTNSVATNAVMTNAVAKKPVTANAAPKKEAALAEARLVDQITQAYVDPPRDFSGVWLTYWMNGMVSYERNYRNGRLDGVTTGFYPNGMASIVIWYWNGVPDGEDVGYFPSGKVQYKGRYRAGIEVGQWFWYREDGSIEMGRDFDVKKSK
jgi:hypothetical protein